MLRKLQKILTLEKVKISASFMIENQFTCSPLIWMFFSKTDMPRVENVLQDHLSNLINLVKFPT